MIIQIRLYRKPGMAKLKTQISPEKLDLYIKLIENNPKVELKGATMPHTSLNGNMFSFLSEAGLGMRLPKEAREEFLERYKTTLYKTFGTVMKEYVTVPDQLLKDTKELKKYFEMSYDYVKGKKPKPTKKKS